MIKPKHIGCFKLGKKLKNWTNEILLYYLPHYQKNLKIKDKNNDLYVTSIN